MIDLGPEELERRNKLADLTMRQQGITFTVYGRKQGVERIIPFDPIPRLIAAARASRFCVARCRESLREIAGGDEEECTSEAQRLLGRLDSELRYSDVVEIFERGLIPFLESIRTTSQRVGNEIQKAYFLTCPRTEASGRAAPRRPSPSV